VLCLCTCVCERMYVLRGSARGVGKVRVREAEFAACVSLTFTTLSNTSMISLSLVDWRVSEKLMIFVGVVYCYSFWQCTIKREDDTQ
jgi:hypothetical protein